LSGAIYRLMNLTHRYGDNVALRIEDLSLREGDIIGVAGPNGSGKSTLLSILALLSAPSAGTVLFDGEKVRFRDTTARRKVTLLLQEPYLLKRTVYENIAYGLKIRQEKNGLRNRIFEVLEWVGLSPDEFAGRRWYELSGGEAQRVALASRLALRPKVLLLDEPLANVDEASAALIKKASLMARREWGATLVIVSHDLAWLYEISDEILSFFKGRLVGSGPENIIVGPWQAVGLDLMVRILDDGQKVICPSKNLVDEVMIIDPSAVKIKATSSDSRAPGEPANTLSGVISQMIHEKARNSVLVKVTAGGISIAARLDVNNFQAKGLHPGQGVRVSF